MTTLETTARPWIRVDQTIVMIDPEAPVTDEVRAWLDQMETSSAGLRALIDRYESEKVAAYQRNAEVAAKNDYLMQHAIGCVALNLRASRFALTAMTILALLLVAALALD